MAQSTIPVDLRNPGQVMACLGLMEMTEVLLGRCEGGFEFHGAETSCRFLISAPGESDPVRAAVGFLARSEVSALAPAGSRLSAAKWQVTTHQCPESYFPAPEPDSPATLPICLRHGQFVIAIEYWLDGEGSIGRDNVKLWAGAAGYPGAALARDAIANLHDLGDNVFAEVAGDPFAFAAAMTSSFRFDWRRDYIPLDAGFSPNAHSTIGMVGFPLVELLAAIGLQNARPTRVNPRDKLAYLYGVWGASLPTLFARAALGGQSLGFPMRRFRMSLGWPGQEGQARCIIDAQEEYE